MLRIPRREESILGLSPVSFFAPAPRLQLAARDPLGPLDEFRDMVKELRRAGIEVILTWYSITPLKVTTVGQH